MGKNEEEDAKLGLSYSVRLGQIGIRLGTYYLVIYNRSPQLCCVYCFAALHTSQHRAHAGDRRAILARCSNVNNDEKFHAQSLQQLQYRAVQTVLFKKNVYLSEKIALK